MINNNFGKKYKIIHILNDLNCGKLIKWSSYLTYNVDTNMVMIRTMEGKDYWMPLQDYICIGTWPLARTGRWPDIYKNCIEITEEEMKEINNNTVDFNVAAQFNNALDQIEEG